MEKAIAKILEEFVGEDWKTDENLKDTPRRVAKLYREILHGYIDFDKKLETITKSVFSSNNKEMIVCSGIKEYTFCPHHLLSVILDVSVGYIPEKLVLGISKIPRLVRLLSSKLVLQEDLTDNIADSLMKMLKPKGVIVLVRGEHMCMHMRGIRSQSKMTTSALRGVFLDNKDQAKNEFFSLIRE